MTSIVGLTFIENFNKLYQLHFLSESNKIVYMYKASSEKLEHVKNFVSMATSPVPTSSR